MTFNPLHNPRYPVEEEPPGGQPSFQSMTADLPWNVYGCAVAWFGRPREIKLVSSGVTPSMQLVEDVHTNRWFMAYSERSVLVQYSKGDAHYFKK